MCYYMKRILTVFALVMTSLIVANRDQYCIERLVEPYEQAIEFIVNLDPARQVNDHDVFVFFNKNDLYENKDVRKFNRPLVKFSNEMEIYHKEIKKFLMDRLYTHFSIKRITNKSKRMVKELFYLYMDDLSCLPKSWQKNISSDKKECAIIVRDFIACMSDRYATQEYKSFFEIS